MSETAVSSLIDEFEAAQPWPLDSFQREAITQLESHRGVLVSAPTSSGKTLIAEYAVWRSLRPATNAERPGHVIYTTPLKALSNQKYRDFCQRYGDHNIGLITGENTVNEDAPVVIMTTEILRNVLYEDPARVDRVGLVVLDEVHYIDDYPRGTVWEEIIIEAPRHIQLVGLSATISNVADVAAWISGLRGPIATVVRTERPVALEMWLAVDNRFSPLFDEKGQMNRQTFELSQSDTLQDTRFRYARRAPENDLLHIIDELNRRQMLPAIYFIFSRRGCSEAAARCAIHGTDLTTREEKDAILRHIDAAQKEIADNDEKALFSSVIDRRQLSRGVAMHHAGMLPSAKELVERLFIAGLIKVVFATETLSLGLNMPARACVVSSFTKFDGSRFHTLTPAELTQLLGRAGRRGIDPIGHGVILKEHDVDVRDIYEVALAQETAVDSKFSPTYNMTLTLLRTRSVAEAEKLLENSFGQYQNLQRSAHWSHRKQNLEERLADLQQQMFRHPVVTCNEKTLTSFLGAKREVAEVRADLRRVRRGYRQSGRGGYRQRHTDSWGQAESLRRQANTLDKRLANSPCRHCPYLANHRSHRNEVVETRRILAGGEAELESNRQRYRREFRAFRRVLHSAGYLQDDVPTPLGLLAASLYGDNALLVADAIDNDILMGMAPEEVAATLVMLVAEDRGRDRPATRRRFPSPRIEQAHRHLLRNWRRLTDIERHEGLSTLRSLSYDFVQPAFFWTSGRSMLEIEPPSGADIGDVVKAMKNLYSMLRQMELALRDHPLKALIRETREKVERDLIRRI